MAEEREMRVWKCMVAIISLSFRRIFSKHASFTASIDEIAGSYYFSTMALESDLLVSGRPLVRNGQPSPGASQPSPDI